MEKRMVLSVFLLSPLLFLIGCGPISKMGSKCSGCGTGAATGEAIVKFGGRTVADAHEYEKAIQAIIASNPQLQTYLPMLPKKELENLFKQIAERVGLEYAMMQWLEDEKISLTEEYKKECEEVCRMIRRDFAVRKFEQEMAKTIVADEKAAQEFYESNKAVRPEFQQKPFLVQEGGVKVELLHAPSNAAANELVKKLAGAVDLKKLAATEKVKHQDLGFVSARTPADAELKELKKVVLDEQKFPATGVVKVSDKKFLVFKAHKKQEAQYLPFEKLDDRIKGWINQEATKTKLGELLGKKMEELKQRYGIVVNDDYITKKVEALRPEKPAEQAPAAVTAAPSQPAEAPVAAPAKKTPEVAQKPAAA